MRLFKGRNARDNTGSTAGHLRYGGRISDPRGKDDSPKSGGRSAPLSIFFEHGDRTVRDSLLLCNLTGAFLSDMVLYFVEGPDDKIAKFWNQMTHEREHDGHIGLLTLSNANRMRLTKFFDKHGGSFWWGFALFNRDRLPAVENLLSEDFDFTPGKDPFAAFARYTIHCNRDMHQTEVLVYERELFDPMIGILRPLCEEWKG